MRYFFNLLPIYVRLLASREVQQLAPVIRESDEVKFSVRVYSALNSNNYVRFFKLVRDASFLCSCLLHRYFSQIRACALQRILRAYILQGHSSMVSESLWSVCVCVLM